MKSPRLRSALVIAFALTLAQSLSTASDFKALPGSANSLEEFAKQVTPDGAKWGGPEFSVEALVVRLPATEQLKELPAEPTPGILAAAAKFHVRLRPGLSSGVEQLTMIDRTPAGVRVANPQPVGMRFYAYALPINPPKTGVKIPAYDVRLMLSYALLEGFNEKGNAIHLMRHFSEANSQLRLTRGWLLMGGDSVKQDDVVESKDSGKRLQKMLRGFYFRIADEYPAESAQPPMQPAQTTAVSGK